MASYPKGEGGLWPHNKKNEKHPDFRGHIYITPEQLKLLLEMYKENQASPDPDFKMKIDVGMWNRVAKQTGAEYKWLGTEVYKAPKEEAQQQQADPIDFDEDIPF